jgi:hypothetical protein
LSAREIEMTASPIVIAIADKHTNMDGDSFERWRFRINQAINDLGREAYLDRETAPMFNCNYDPKTAAREWLRKRLAVAP